jgi:hypothetical protein
MKPELIDEGTCSGGTTKQNDENNNFPPPKQFEVNQRKN